MEKQLAVWAWGGIVLLLVCLSHISIDILLPSLPAMALMPCMPAMPSCSDLSLFMAGSAASMLACGPLADRYGRRPRAAGRHGHFCARQHRLHRHQRRAC